MFSLDSQLALAAVQLNILVNRGTPQGCDSWLTTNPSPTGSLKLFSPGEENLAASI